MPKLTDVKDRIVQVLDDPNIKPEVFARPLRMAHKLTTGARGPYAPNVTLYDYARLLIVILAPGYAKDSVRTLNTYRNLVLRNPDVGARGHRNPEPERVRDFNGVGLMDLGKMDYLEDLFIFLLRLGADGTLQRMQQDVMSAPSDVEPSGRPLSLNLIGPTPAAVLRLHPATGAPKQSLIYIPRQKRGTAERPRDPNMLPKLQRSVEIYDNTFIALGQLFAAEVVSEAPPTRSVQRRPRKKDVRYQAG